MRIVIDTNVLISAFVLSSKTLAQMVDDITEHYTIVIPTYVIDELKRVTKEKFPGKSNYLESFLLELPYELVYTPDDIDISKYPGIHDEKDLPVLITAIIEPMRPSLCYNGKG